MNPLAHWMRTCSKVCVSYNYSLDADMNMKSMWDAFNIANKLRPNKINDLISKTPNELLKDKDFLSQISKQSKELSEKLFKMAQEDDKKEQDKGESDSSSSKNSSTKGESLEDNPYRIFKEDKDENGFFKRHYEKAKTIIKRIFNRKK
jgi:hypothetical protein